MAYGSTLRAILGAGGGYRALFASTAYSGTGAAQDIATGQNLAGGGLVWLKRTDSSGGWGDFDTGRGVQKLLQIHNTNGEATDANSLTAFNANGFTVGTSFSGSIPGQAYTAFTWLEQAGYLDIVAYSGNGSSRTISHNLGVAPKMIIVKRRTTGNWFVYHEHLTSAGYTIELQGTGAQFASNSVWNSTDPTSSVFSVGTSDDVNNASGTYVAYLFAEKAGFSKMGSYTGNGTVDGDTQAITGAGFRPNAALIKSTTATQDWIFAYNDNGTLRFVVPNTTAAAALASARVSSFDADGLTVRYQAGAPDTNTNGETYIYTAWK